MSKKFYDTPQAKKLIAEWDKKLKDSGFHDIETPSEKKNGTVEKQKITVDHARVVYNQKCQAWLNAGNFKDATDKFIFEQHCEGTSNRDIAILLGLGDLDSLHPATVDRRLLRMLEQAQIEPIVFNF